MTKHLKRFALFMVMAVMLLAGTLTAYAADGIENPYIETIHGASVIGTSPVIFRDTSTGMPAYCIDHNRGIPDPESLSGEFDPMTIFDPDTYRGLEYLLLAGYPFETGGLSDTEAQACTQLAVWCWTGETLGYGLNADNYHATNGRDDIYEYFIGLMEAARNQTPPDIGIDCDDIEMQIDGDTMTGTATVTIRNLSGYAVDEGVLPEGIAVSGCTGENGDALVFTASLDYAGETITLENLFTGQDTRSALNLFWYDNSNPNQQRMVISYYDETTIAVAAGLSLRFEELPVPEPEPEPTEGKIRLIKKDDDNGKRLSGAVFGVYRASDNVKVCELKTNSRGEAVSPLLPENDYYLKELKAPDSYELSKDKYGATVRADKTVEITITNQKTPETEPEPEPTEGRIRLIKKDDESDKRLSGAVFGVYRATDDVKVCELETNSRGEVVSPRLPEGDYYLKELKAPDSYELSKEKHGVTVKADKMVEITITNTKTPEPEPTPDPTPTPTPKPTPAPADPKPTPTPKPNTPTGELVLLKKAEQTGNPLAGAVFGVYRVSDNEKAGELTTKTDGRAALSLAAGDYYLLELKAPYGFLLEKAKICFSVAEDSTVTVEVTNQRDETIPAPDPIEIPKTGESVPYTNYIMGAFLLAVSATLGGTLYVYRRKRVGM